ETGTIATDQDGERRQANRTWGGRGGVRRVIDVYCWIDGGPGVSPGEEDLLVGGDGDETRAGCPEGDGRSRRAEDREDECPKKEPPELAIWPSLRRRETGEERGRPHPPGRRRLT